MLNTHARKRELAKLVGRGAIFVLLQTSEKKSNSLPVAKRNFAKSWQLFSIALCGAFAKFSHAKKVSCASFLVKLNCRCTTLQVAFPCPSQPQNKVAIVDFCLAMWYNAQKGVCPSVAKGNVSNAQGGAK